MTRRTQIVIVVALVVLGACARLPGLGRESIWTDEMHTIRVGGISTVSSEVAWRVGDLLHVTQGPLFVGLLHGWSAIVGVGEARLRLLPALFGLLAIPPMWLLGRRLLGEPGAVVAATLLALSPFHVWYSRELRGYSLLVLAVLWSTWFVICAYDRLRARSPAWSALAGSVAWTVIGLGSSFAMALVSAVHGLAALLSLRALAPGRRFYLIALATMIVVSVLAWPWLGTVAERFDWGGLIGRGRSDEALRSAAAFSPAAVPYTFFVFAAGFSLGPSLAELHTGASVARTVAAHSGIIILVGLLFGSAVVVGLARVAGRSRPRAVFLAAWVVLPMLLLAVLASGEVKAWNPRYVSGALPAFIILVAAAIDPRSRLGRAWLVALVALSVVSIIQLHTEPRYWKEDYRGAGLELAAGLEPGDAIVAEGAPWPIFFYAPSPGERFVFVQAHRYPWPEAQRRIDEAIDGARRIWLVRARAWQSDVVPDYLAGLGEPVVDNVYRGVTLSRFDRPPPATPERVDR